MLALIGLAPVENKMVKKDVSATFHTIFPSNGANRLGCVLRERLPLTNDKVEYLSVVREVGGSNPTMAVKYFNSY